VIPGMRHTYKYATNRVQQKPKKGEALVTSETVHSSMCARGHAVA
jgi:hypothetical protein